MLSIADEVFPIGVHETERAKEILLGLHGLSPRDALHVAVMRANGVDRIATFDAAFDGVSGVERLS